MTLMIPELNTGIVMIDFSYILNHSQYPYNMGTGSQCTALPLISASMFVHIPTPDEGFICFLYSMNISNLRKYNITFDRATEYHKAVLF